MFYKIRARGSKIYTLRLPTVQNKTNKKEGDHLVNFATIEKSFVAIFAVMACSAVFLATVLNMGDIALLLLLVNFIVAGFIAIFGSLRSRAEEEEKRLK
jgi:site-specific recombinase